MAKKTAGKKRGPRVNSVPRLKFLETFCTMAKDGKTALEIANALDVKGTDAQKIAFVSVKASNLRKHRADKIAAGKMGADTPEIPNLRAGRSGSDAEMASVLTRLLGKLETPPTVPPADGQTETPVVPTNTETETVPVTNEVAAS